MKVGRDLDDETLALQLMKSAGLREELSQLVITGIDEEREDIFDQTKRAMREYLGIERAGISAKGDIKIKEEVFESVKEEVLYARNNFCSPISSQGNMRGGFTLRRKEFSEEKRYSRKSISEIIWKRSNKR